jgi:long-chain acyl-CoA synthetase
MVVAAAGAPARTRSELVSGLLAQTAEAAPGALAVACGERRMTYAELAAEVDRLAAGLAAAGVGPGDAVALLAAPGTPSLLGILGILGAGAVAVPMSPASKPAELRFCVEDSGARVVLTDGSLEAAPPPSARVLVLDDVLGAGRHAAPVSVAVAPDADALFLYSAGATGRPKRVPRTHRQLVAESRSVVAALELTPEDSVFSALPLFHAYGLGCCLLAALRSGASLLFAGDRIPFALDRARVLALLEHAGATVFPAVPFHLRVLAEAPGAARLSGLRLCLSAGNALPRATFEAFTAAFGVTPRQLYGCTEAGAVTANIDGDPVRTAGSVGRALDGVELAVVGADGAPVETGRLGEITIRSEAMTRGYAGVDPVVNRDAFPGGAFLTGDRGRLDAEGRLWLTGRRKRLIDVRGDKVDPVEVEDVLAVHPKVREVVVVGVQGPVEGEDLVKAVVVADGTCGARELVRFCRERLADHKAPQLVEFCEEIPRSPLGEVLRKYLV